MTAIDPSLDLGQTSGSARPPAGQDLAMLAHDIRGALHGVIGGMGELEASSLPDALREQVDRVATAARSLASLTAIMLGDPPDPVARAAGGDVRLPAFLRGMERRWAGEAREKGLGFEIVTAPDLPPALRLDHLPLARALGNLISNAIKHTASGTVRVAATRAPDGGMALRVTDEGPGLPEAVLHCLRVGGAPEPVQSGHGLGLQIVRQVTEQIGGSFAIANRRPHGVEAVIRLPGALCVEPEPAAAAAPAAGRLGLDGARILLAEDNPTNQMVATQMLHALNARVTVCSDGIEALERFEEAPFDMVVVDIEMPRMSGLDVIRTIRARTDSRANVAIVALTAYALREHRDRVLEAGANGLISKPITSIEALGQGLAAHLAAQPPAAPEPEPSADPGPVVDRDIFAALVEAIGPGMMAELLEKVVADLVTARGELAGALGALDRGPIRAASHILISVAGAVGANRLQARARSLNAAAHAGTDAAVADETRRCIDEIAAAVAFVRDERGSG